MYINGIAVSFISGIPAERIMPGVVPSVKAMQKVVEIIPERPVSTFDLDQWDFTACFRNVCSESHILNFRRCIPAARPLVKLYALHLIDRQCLKIRTIYNIVKVLTTLLNGATYETSHRDFMVLTAGEILAYLGDVDNERRPDTIASYISVVKRFYEFLNSEHIYNIVDVEELEFRRRKLGKMGKFWVIHHHPDIPNEFYQIIKRRLDGIMRDETAPINDRLTAGVILMDTQMGLRKSEIPIIKVGMIQKVDTKVGPRDCAVYYSLKTSRHLIEPKEVKMVCSPLLKRTYEYYVELRRRIPESELTDNLYIQQGVATYPVRRDDLARAYCRLMATRVPETKQSWGEIRSIAVRYIGHDDERFFIPNIHSYRVHVTSTFAARGYPYVYTEHMLSHAFQAWGQSQNDGYYSGAANTDTTNPYEDNR